MDQRVEAPMLNLRPSRYETACDTTDNNIDFGPLDQVASYGWSGDDCSIGTTGSYNAFNPGPDSYFFVVVGHQNTVEGSYGKDRQAGGTEAERPPFVGNSCGQTQELVDRCD